MKTTASGFLVPWPIWDAGAEMWDAGAKVWDSGAKTWDAGAVSQTT
jgi:hypothetical protein